MEPGGEIVHHVDLLAQGDQGLGQVGAYETGPAGDERPGGLGGKLIHGTAFPAEVGAVCRGAAINYQQALGKSMAGGGGERA